MFQPPKRQKYRKMQKGRNTGLAKNCEVHFGEIGLQLVGRCRLTARQIEAGRRALVRKIKRTGKLWIRVFPDKPITSKPLEVRQGKGKGNVDYYAYEVKPGAILFELAGVDEDLAKEALMLAAAKLPVRSQVVHKTIERKLEEEKND